MKKKKILQRNFSQVLLISFKVKIMMCRETKGILLVDRFKSFLFFVEGWYWYIFNHIKSSFDVCMCVREKNVIVTLVQSFFRFYLSLLWSNVLRVQCHVYLNNKFISYFSLIIYCSFLFFVWSQQVFHNPSILN